ncbi:CotH kinase family protein [Microbacterium istanbulense]|uniref:CotH kinase family protein n=1 Tax=Microbacterium istanbulense TaxID=3122049 RepID=A0ABU8LFZ4_9MICO
MPQIIRARALAAAGAATTLALLLTSCTATATADDGASAASGLWDSGSVHEITIDFDQDAYDAMVQTYLDSETKEWISATVTIDGVTYENAGLKLKGNSSLRALSTDADAELSAENPEDLPWVIRLDKFVEGQNHEGTTELVVRGNSTETALNEALALELLDAAGLASEQAIAVRFSADGSDETLRLVIENPNDAWMQAELGDGLLYKAEAGGDYSYRGDEATAYTDGFDQEGGESDLTPLIDFLQWVNESSDDEFAAGLADRLDVDAFATYLAFQDLVQNTDDIDGPGNNSYLYYDPATERMTVVNWDLNLAFGASPGGGGPGGAGGFGGGDGAPPAGDGGMPGAPGAQEAPTDSTMPTRPTGGGPAGRSNILVERFLATDEFAALYAEAQETLQEELVDSGVAADALQEWTQVLIDDAADLVTVDVIQQESDDLAAQLKG